jgi:hypothetical protein
MKRALRSVCARRNVRRSAASFCNLKSHGVFNASLQRLAKYRGISVNKLMEESSTIGLAQFDAELRFRALASKGSPGRALAVLDELDAAFGRTKGRA